MTSYTLPSPSKIDLSIQNVDKKVLKEFGSTQIYSAQATKRGAIEENRIQGRYATYLAYGALTIGVFIIESSLAWIPLSIGIVALLVNEISSDIRAQALQAGTKEASRDFHSHMAR